MPTPTVLTLADFNTTDGANPSGSVFTDANGDLLGTTNLGGANNAGTVFEIVKAGGAYASTPTTLVSFNGANGAQPFSSLLTDANGDLFGSTVFGGSTYSGGNNTGLGTAFEIVNTGSSYASTPTTLVSFNGTNGAYPRTSLIADANGDLFGTTNTSGPGGYGTVFEIVKTGTTYASTPTTLISFNFTNGAYPFAGLIADANGDLFGTTYLGGANFDGTVFEIVKTGAAYASTPTTLVSFNAANGYEPFGGLIADTNGDLFGTTLGGGTYGAGTVFEIVKTGTTYASTPTTLISFNGTNGSTPYGGLVADANGDLYGTTYSGGASGNGTVFEIVKTGATYATTPTTLVNFNGTNGAQPQGSLIADANGELFGTTFSGGANGQGTVFEIILLPAVSESLVSDTGSSSSDKITSNDALTGGGDANAVVTFTEGGSTLGTATANGGGTWSFTPSLSDGPHTIVASETDTAGNTGSASLTFTLDTAAPAVSESLVSDTGSSSSDQNTSNAALTGGGDANAVVTFKEGASTVGTATANGGGTWSFTPSLSDGPHTIVASETDTAGNTGSASLTFTLDTAAPAVSESLVSDTGSSSSDQNTSNAALTGGGDANAVVTFKEGASTVGTATANGGGTWSFTPSLSDGPHTIVASETDTAGNTGSASLTFTLDTAAPAVSESLVSDTGSSSSDQNTSNAALTGGGDANAVVTFKEGASTVGTATANGGGTWSFTPSLSDGPHTIVASETDTAGNTGSASLTFTLDTAAPAVSESLVSDTGSSSSDKITSNDALTGGGDANAVVTFTEGASTLGTATANGGGTWSFTPSLSDGPHTIVASETDTAGNTGSASLTFTLDTAAPAVSESLVSDTGSSSSDQNTSNAALTGGGDANAVVTFKEGASTVGTATANGGGTWSFTPSLSDGPHTIVASETDTAGNTGSASLTFTLDQDLGEQAALALTVNGGTAIGAATAGVVPFTVVGLESDDSGTVTFSDGTPARDVVINIVAGAPVSSTANLSGLTDGSITATLHLNNDAVGNSFTDVVVHPTLDQDTDSSFVRLGSEFLVNTQTANDQLFPTVTGLTNGGFVVTWHDSSGTLGDSDSTSVKAQVFDASGSAVGSEFLVNTQTANYQVVPTITGLTNGGFVVTWQDMSGTLGDSDGTSIKAQVFDASGSEVGSEFLVNTQTANHQLSPTITGLTNGGFVVTWEDYSGTLGDSDGNSIKAQVFDASGSKVGSEFLVNTQTANYQARQTITGLTNGGFVVTWYDLSGTLGDSDGASIKAQVFDASGSKVGSEFLVNTQTANYQVVPTITGLTNGGFVVTWEDFSGTLGDTDGASIKAQVFDASGSKVGSEFLVNTQTAKYQVSPTITGLTNGGFVVTWQDSSGTLGDSDNNSIKAQVFDASGSKVGSEFLVNTQTADSQFIPTIAGLINGGFVVTWDDWSGTLGDSDATSIKAQIYTAAGEQAALSLSFGDTTIQTAQINAVHFTVGDLDAEDSATATFTDHLGGTVTKTVSANGTSTVDLTGLADGTITASLQVATDPAGNTFTPVAASNQATLDTAPPAVSESLVSDTGSSSSDKITSNDALTGGGDANAVVTFTEGASTLGTTTANVSGTWSFTPSLSDGPHTIVASETDSAGNTGSASLSFILDTTAPFAATPLGSTFLVNTNTTGNQLGSTITGLSNGGFVITWEEDSGTLGSSNIKAQIYDAAGAKVGSEFLVNTQTANDQGPETIGSLSNGGFVITWQDYSRTLGDSDGTSIKAQIFDATGAKVGSEFLVNTQTANWQFAPIITGLNNGGFVVTWYDLSGTLGDSDGSSIKAQIFNATGAKVGSEFLVNSQTASFQQFPSVAALSNGGFVVTWSDDSETLGDSDLPGIKAQIFDATGAKVGSEFLVNTQTAGPQDMPTVTGLSNGGFVITWQDGSGTLGDSDESIKGQIYDATGTKFGGEFLVNTQTAGAQVTPHVTALNNGGFVIAWTDESSGFPQGGGKAQVFDATGAKAGSEFLVNTPNGGPTIAGLSNGGFAATWTDTSGTLGDTDGSSVNAQMFAIVPAVTEMLAADTGASSSDDITSNPALTGTADPSALVNLSESSTTLGATAADSNGVWNFTPTGLAGGIHTITASETDTAGNTATASLTFTLTPVTWTNGVNGTWQTASDWTPNLVPGVGESVFITPSGTYTVTDPQTTTIYSVATAAGATLDITGGTFTIYAGTDAGANAGTIKVEGSAILDVLPSTIANTGTLKATTGGTIDLTGVTVTNTSGTLTTSTPLALDGNGFVNKSVPTTSASVSLTTHSANDVIILDIVQNGASVSSVTDAAGLVWHQRAVTGTAGQTIYEYYAIAPNALSSDAIIVNFAGAASYVDLNAFGVSGANTSSPFDSNVSVPASPAASTGSITTSNANDLIVAGYRFGSTAAPAAGGGWTAINASGNYYLSEYQIVSATQAGLVATASTGDENGGVIDAIVQAPATMTTTAGAMTVDASSTLDLNHTTITGGALSNAGTVDVTGGATSTLDGVSLSNAGGSMTVVAPFGLDGNGFANKAVPTTSASVSLTTTHTNDVIILDIVQNSASVSSVTDTAGLVWHQRAVTGTGVQTIYEYYATAANALSADAITVNFAGAASYVDLNAFGISGANTSSPFDSNVSVPATPAASTGAVTTSNANDFIVAGYRFGSNATPAAGGGWTAINAGGNYYLSEYQIVSSTQAGLVATASTGDENGGIVDAIVQAVAPPPTTPGVLTVDAGSTLDLNNTTISGGTITNAGTVDVTGSSISTLNGVGVTDTGAALTVDATATLDLNNTTITGGALSNNGTVDSTGTSALNGVAVSNSSLLEVTSGTLTIDPSAVTNTGTLEATTGGTLDLEGISVANTGGTVEADTASTLNLNNTTITGGTLSNAGTMDVTGGATSTLAGVGVTNTGMTVTTSTPLALDGNGFVNKSVPTTSASVSLTTHSANDVIILDIVQNGASVSSVTDAAGLVWHQRAVTGTAGQTIYEYYAIAPNALSSDAIIVNFAGAASYVDLNAFGVSGANTSSPFDSNVSVPASPAASTGSITTSNANDLIVAGYRFGSTAAPAAGGGWTAINASGNYYLSEYQIVSATQAGLVATASTGDENGGVIDAIVQAPATMTTTAGAMTVDASSTLDLNHTTITGGALSNAGTVDVTGGATSTLDGVSLSNAGGSMTVVAPFGLDGNGFANKAVPTTSASVSLTTTHTNDVIILDIVQNSASVSSVTDTAGLVWHQRAVTGTGVQTIYEYYATAANALSADAITVNFAGAASYVDLNAFGISGANTSSPFDSNVSVPATPAASTGAVTTSNANDFIVAGYRFGSNATPAAGGGWTAINAGGNYYLSEYQIVSSTQAGLVATASTGDENGGIVDAIVQAVAPPPTTPGVLTVDAGSTLDLNNTTISGGTITNAGTVDSTGTSAVNGVIVTNSSLLEVTGGQLTVNAAVTNTGNLLANNGATLDITGAVTGNGTATISGTNSVLEFGAASAEDTTFSAAVDGMLKLDNASGFTGTVAGLATGDSIDLTSILFSSNPTIIGVTGTGAVGTTTNVMVQDGAQSVTLQLLNQSVSQFAVDPMAYSLVADNNNPNHGTLFQLAAAPV